MDEPGLAGVHPESSSSFSTAPITLSSVLFQTSLAGMTISGVVLDLVLLVILKEEWDFYGL